AWEPAVERVLVGLAAVALLLDGAEHGRADYIFVCQLPGPSSGEEQFSNSRGLTVDAAGNVLVPDAVHQHMEAFCGGRLFLTDFDNPSGGVPPSEPNGPVVAAIERAIAGDWQK